MSEHGYKWKLKKRTKSYKGRGGTLTIGDAAGHTVSFSGSSFFSAPRVARFDDHDAFLGMLTRSQGQQFQVGSWEGEVTGLTVENMRVPQAERMPFLSVAGSSNRSSIIPSVQYTTLRYEGTLTVEWTKRGQGVTYGMTVEYDLQELLRHGTWPPPVVEDPAFARVARTINGTTTPY